MNVLVTGSAGQLGTHIRLAAGQSSHRFFFTDVDDLDITNSMAINEYVTRHAIQAVVNCAAFTNVDAAEDNVESADNINHKAVVFLADAMKKVQGLLIHISTDYVFGGNMNNTPCDECQPTNPTGVYGATKLAGERAVVNSGCNYVIIRTSWLYSEYGKNFVKTMLSLTETKPSLNVVFDQVGTPTYAGDLAQFILAVLDDNHLSDKFGTYHFSNEGVCSWFDFAKEIARQAQHDHCAIAPCHSHEFPSKVVRPSYSVLDKSKAKSVFGVTIPYWTDSLTICLNNLLN